MKKDLHKERTQRTIKLNNNQGDEADDLYLHIIQMFGCIQKTTAEDATKLLVLGDVEVEISIGSILIEWTKNSMVSETIANSILIMIIGLNTSEKNVLSESRLKERSDDAWRAQELQNLLQEQFGNSFSVDEKDEKKENAKNGSVTIGTVSYTHLDVYKRQILGPR